MDKPIDHSRRLCRTISAPPFSRDTTRPYKVEEEKAYLELQVYLLTKELNSYKKKYNMLQNSIKKNNKDNIEDNNEDLISF